MNDKPKESDWKIYRDSLVSWRERYFEKKNKELAEFFNNHSGTPTEQFWEMKEKMDEQANILQDCLDGVSSRSKMNINMVALYRHGFVDDKDLERFSDEFREWMSRITDGEYEFRM